MIAGTYLISGVLLAISAVLFKAGALNAITQTLCWCVIFFFASAGARAAYLTVSEIFPVEVRAKAIAVFFAIAQCFGAFGPVALRPADRQRPEPRQAVLRLPARRRGMASAASSPPSSASTPRAGRSRTSRARCRR